MRLSGGNVVPYPFYPSELSSLGFIGISEEADDEMSCMRQRGKNGSIPVCQISELHQPG